MSGLIEQWYAVCTAPSKEAVTAKILKLRGFEVFLPVRRKLCKVSRYRPGVTEWRDFPLLQRYLFAKLGGPVPRWRELFEISCVQGVVTYDDRPYAIDKKVIKKIRERSAMGEFTEGLGCREHVDFAEGDQVRVCDGPFSGFEGQVEKIRGQRAKTTLELFGVERSVEMPLDDLEKSP